MGPFPAIAGRGGRFREALQYELSCQVQMVLDHGFQPVHLNGHHYVELLPAVAEIIPALLVRFGIKVVRIAAERSFLRTALLSGCPWHRWLLSCARQTHALRFSRRMRRLGVGHPDCFYGAVDAARTDMRRMRWFLSHSRDFRLAEIVLHPAVAPGGLPEAADGWRDPLADLRPTELDMLLSPELPDLLEERHLRLGRLAEAA